MKAPRLIPVLVAAAVAPLIVASPARAQEPSLPPSWEESQEMLEQGARRVIGALELLLQAIPQYELPEVLPNGDILIRRKNPDRETPPEQGEDRDRT